MSKVYYVSKNISFKYFWLSWLIVKKNKIKSLKSHILMKIYEIQKNFCSFGQVGRMFANGPRLSHTKDFKNGT